jgi:hypothetical protein
MRDKLQRFMYGRYGNDDLNRAISIVTLGSIIAEMITHIHILYWVSLILLILLYYRMMSRNVSARWAENQKYLQMRGKVTGIFRGGSSGQKADPYYRILVCPQCKQKVRVPKGKGKIRIHCPKCGNDFIKKS